MRQNLTRQQLLRLRQRFSRYRGEAIGALEVVEDAVTATLRALRGGDAMDGKISNLLGQASGALNRAMVQQQMARSGLELLKTLELSLVDPPAEDVDTSPSP